MAIIVNTNMSALKTQRNLNNATNGMNKALERMSTGYKINSAKDDAANMYIATNLDVQISGSKVAKNNISTAANMLSIAEGDLDVILDNVTRIRDLTVQASNGIYDEDSMKALTDEITARMAEIDRISESSNFNGMQLLNGNEAFDNGVRLQVGANADGAANCVVIDAEIFEAKDSKSLGLDAAQIATNYADASAASKYLDTIDDAITNINTAKAAIGATGNRLDAATDSLTTTIENMTAAHSTIMDADIAEEAANYTQQQILQQTASSLLVQANSLPSIALSLIQ